MAASRKRWPVAVLLALAVGVPWPLLQSLAWLKMIASYSGTATFSQAVSMSLDGKHPCRLCRLIQQGQAQERQHQRTLSPDDKLQLGLPPETAPWTHPPFLSPLPAAGALTQSWRAPPVTPPPRSA
jgi:hypothetical protein